MSTSSTATIKKIASRSKHLILFIIMTLGLNQTSVSSAIMRPGDSNVGGIENLIDTKVTPKLHPFGSSFEHLDNRPKVEVVDFSSPDPISTAASDYHHAGDSKGWLNMGSYTKDKGSFGWYVGFPVGEKR